MEDQISKYTDARFNPSNEAQRFFAAYGEHEISRKLTEMSKLQQQIETVLKQTVKDNYLVFLQANDQIAQVGQEMQDLKHLIQNTRKLIQDVQGTKIGEHRAMRANSLLPVIQFRMAADEIKRLADKVKQSEVFFELTGEGIPLWLTKASDELAEYIVEQQYQKAVAIVLKSRSYVESLEKNTTNMTAANNKALESLKKVNDRSTHLAEAIKKSLLSLPNSPLWGVTEQLKRLKLLIALHEYREAGEGFSLIKNQHIQRALHSVETTANIAVYARDLSKSFFSELLAAVSSFFTLFEDQLDSPEIITILLEWTQTQTADFIRVLIEHVKIAVSEATLLMLLYLRDPAVFVKGLHRPSTEAMGNALAEAVRLTPPRRSSFVRLSSSVMMQRHSSVYNGVAGSSIGPAVAPTGGMYLLSQTIVVVLQSAEEYQAQLSNIRISFAPSSPDSKSGGAGGSGSGSGGGSVNMHRSLSNYTNSPSPTNNTSASSNAGNNLNLGRAFPMVSTCSFFLLPQLRRIFCGYADEFINDVTSQVRQDVWLAVSSNNLDIIYPASHNPVQQRQQAEEVMAVSSSYLWVVTALNYLVLEVMTLLNQRSPDDNDNSGNVGNMVAILSKLDVSELEPTCVTALLRFLLRYVVEIESLDPTGFTKAQLTCFVSTLDAIMRRLIISLQLVMERSFVTERMQLLPNSPLNVFKTINMRLMRIKQQALEAVQ